MLSLRSSPGNQCYEKCCRLCGTSHLLTGLLTESSDRNEGSCQRPRRIFSVIIWRSLQYEISYSISIPSSHYWYWQRSMLFLQWYRFILYNHKPPEVTRGCIYVVLPVQTSIVSFPWKKNQWQSVVTNLCFQWKWIAVLTLLIIMAFQSCEQHQSGSILF